MAANYANMAEQADSEVKLPSYPMKKKTNKGGRPRSQRHTEQNSNAKQQQSYSAKGTTSNKGTISDSKLISTLEFKVNSPSGRIKSASGTVAEQPPTIVSDTGIQQFSSTSKEVDMSGMRHFKKQAPKYHTGKKVTGSTQGVRIKQQGTKDGKVSHSSATKAESGGPPKVKKSDNGAATKGIYGRSKPHGTTRSRKSHTDQRKSSPIVSKGSVQSHKNPEATLEASATLMTAGRPVQNSSSSNSRDEKATVIIQSSPPLLEEISQANWKSLFGTFLPAISGVNYFHPEDKDEFHIQVVFHSSSSAEDAVLALNNSFVCGVYKLSLHLQMLEQSTVLQVSCHDPSIAFENKDSFLKSVISKKRACEKRSEEEIAKLKAEQLTQVKNVPIGGFEEIEELVKVPEKMTKLLEMAIEESVLRKEVFLACCNDILEVYSSVGESASQLDALRADFDREVNRYDKALPIYAHSLDIIEMIENHQVSIVIGETGSGKSTQLVQYLQEAGYAEKGLIVCTQPRKLAAISLAEHVSSEVNEQVGDTYGYVAAQSKKGIHQHQSPVHDRSHSSQRKHCRPYLVQVFVLGD